MNIDAGGEMDNHFEEVSLKVERQPINPLDYALNPAELEVQYGLRRLGVQNSPKPQVCPTCKGPLQPCRGMVGEAVLIRGTSSARLKRASIPISPSGTVTSHASPSLRISSSQPM
jgi:hypothetical protein